MQKLCNNVKIFRILKKKESGHIMNVPAVVIKSYLRTASFLISETISEAPLKTTR
jgi:hypothetical protein